MNRSRSRPPSPKAATKEPRPLSVLIVNRQRSHPVKVEDIRALLVGAAAALNVTGEVAVVFAGDALLRRLNRDHRGRDKPTDVLSFESLGEGMGLGDVIISVPTARANAARGARSLDRELQVLALHGFLHALGYDHEADQGQMEALERRLQRRLLGSGARRIAA